MAGHGFLHIDVGIDDLEESKSILVDVDTAELSNFIGCISNEANKVTAEVCMNLRSVDVGKVEGARSDSSQVGDGAGSIPPRIWLKYFAGRRL